MEISVTQSMPSYQMLNAILLYGSSTTSVDMVTLHDVEEVDNRPIIKEGTLASKQSLLNLLCSLTGHVKKPLQLLHPNVLAVSDQCLVWWEPAKVHRMTFSCAELGKRTAFVPQPALVFCVVDGDWYVHALSINKRPDDQTLLNVAPYFNVWQGGHICVGSTALPKNGSSTDPDEWTDAFFKSAFTHPNIHEKNALIIHPNGVYAFWRDMLDGKYDAFPSHLLVPTKVTLKALLAACQRKSGINA